MRAPTKLQPAAVMSSASPKTMRSAMPSARIASAALRVRMSLPSGSTMVFLSAFARAIMESRNWLTGTSFLTGILSS